MKKIVFTILALFFVTTKAQTHFDFNKLYLSKDCKDTVCVRISLKNYHNGTLSNETDIECISTSAFEKIHEYNDETNIYYFHTKDSLILVDFVNENFSHGNPGNDYKPNLTKYIWENHFDKMFYNLPFCVHKKYTKQPAFTVSDTTLLKKTHYKLIKYTYLSAFEYDSVTRTYSIPINDSVTIWYNEKTAFIEKISIMTSNFSEHETLFELSNISHGTNSFQLWETDLFDIENERYLHFCKYNLNNNEIPTSEMGKISTENISDTLLNFPLVDINHDTTTINKFNGWILLDFWIFGCPPCAEFHQTLKTELDSLGYYSLNEENINIACIYIRGGASKTFENYVKHFGIESISYAARDISLIYNIPNYPKYVLLSPEKQIIYTGSSYNINNIKRLKQSYNLVNKP